MEPSDLGCPAWARADGAGAVTGSLRLFLVPVTGALLTSQTAMLFDILTVGPGDFQLSLPNDQSWVSWAAPSSSKHYLPWHRPQDGQG